MDNNGLSHGDNSIMKYFSELSSLITISFIFLHKVNEKYMKIFFCIAFFVSYRTVLDSTETNEICETNSENYEAKFFFKLLCIKKKVVSVALRGAKMWNSHIFSYTNSFSYWVPLNARFPSSRRFSK
jgi:hypothetical protein